MNMERYIDPQGGLRKESQASWNTKLLRQDGVNIKQNIQKLEWNFLVVRDG